jgi:RNA methyltransferase, TrmH family
VPGIAVKALTSGSNPLYRRWLKLATAPRAVRELQQTLAEGLHLAQAAIDAGVPIDAAILRRGAALPQMDRLLQQLARSVPCYELAPSLYDRIAPVERSAGLTLAVPVASSSLPRASSLDLVYLDGIQDPVNVGAVLRSAAAAGVRDVLCSPGCAIAWAPRAMRAAMGAHFRLNIREGVEPDAIGACLDGPWIAAVVMRHRCGLFRCRERRSAGLLAPKARGCPRQRWRSAASAPAFRWTAIPNL